MKTQRRLLVEGSNDSHVLRHLCREHGLDTIGIETVNCEGIDRLRDAIRVGLKARPEEGDAVGIVVDANSDAGSRWYSIRSRLLGVGYQNLQKELDPDGIIVPATNGPELFLPQVGIWIMPNNRDAGALEDFLMSLVPQSQDLLFDYASHCVSGIPECPRRFAESAESKAILHTWLAWQEQPGKPFGVAIKTHVLDPCCPSANALVAWLRRLFVPPTHAPEA